MRYKIFPSLFLLLVILLSFTVTSVFGGGIVTVKPIFQIISCDVLPNEVRIGEKVLFSVTLRNNDDKAREFFVAIRITDSKGKEVFSEEESARIRPSEISTITFSWLVKEGTISGYYNVFVKIWIDNIFETREIINAFKVVLEEEKIVNLPVPYLHQVYDTPNDFDGRHACGATSTIMVLSYYRKLAPWPFSASKPYEHISEFGNYVSKKYTYNGHTFDTMTPDASGNPAYGAYGYIHHNDVDPTDHRAWAYKIQEFLGMHGIESDRYVYPHIKEEVIKNALKSGRPVIASIWIKFGETIHSKGHVVVIKGYNDIGYIINDPFGKYAMGKYDGENVVYSYLDKGILWDIKWVVIPTTPIELKG